MAQDSSISLVSNVKRLSDPLKADEFGFSASHRRFRITCVVSTTLALVIADMLVKVEKYMSTRSERSSPSYLNDP